MKIRFFSFLFTLLFTCGLFAQEKVFEAKLENGLQIVVIHNPKGPTVYHSLWYKVGSADSPQGLSGIAHFMEHLMFKGTQKFPKNSVMLNVNRIGGIQNAETTQDHTVYWQVSDKKHLPLLMEMEADRMYNIVFNEDEISKEIKVVLNERRSRVDVSSTEKVSEAARNALFWNHPYGKPVIGYESEIESYSLGSVQKFYNDWYTPSNAILIVAGDITLEEVKALAEKYYGPLLKKDPVSRKRLQEPPHHRVTNKVILRDGQTKGTYFEWLYSVPNYRSAQKDPEALKKLLGLEIIGMILADPTYGALYEVLIHQHKLAYRMSSGFQGLGYDPDLFYLNISPDIVLDVERIEGIVQGMLYEMALNGPRAEQLAYAKERYSLGVEYSKRSLSGFANTLGSLMVVGFTYADLKRSEEMLKNLTVEDIKQSVSTYLLTGPVVQVYSYPDIVK